MRKETPPPMAISKKTRQLVWNKSNGVCWYCGSQLPEKGWHVDHFHPVHRKSEIVPVHERKNIHQTEVRFTGEMQHEDLDTLDNMVPSCAPCNLFKSVFPVEEFRKELEKQVERGRKSSVNFRTAERFGQIVVKTTPIVFWFEMRHLRS